jgi:hypothetical protein
MATPMRRAGQFPDRETRLKRGRLAPDRAATWDARVVQCRMAPLPLERVYRAVFVRSGATFGLTEANRQVETFGDNIAELISGQEPQLQFRKFLKKRCQARADYQLGKDRMDVDAEAPAHGDLARSYGSGGFFQTT